MIIANTQYYVFLVQFDTPTYFFLFCEVLYFMAIVHRGECTDKPRVSITVSVGYAFMSRVYYCTLLVLVLTTCEAAH